MWLRVANNEITTWRTGVIYQCVTNLLPGRKAYLLARRQFKTFVAKAQCQATVENKHMLFFEHVIVRLIGLPARCQHL